MDATVRCPKTRDRFLVREPPQGELRASEGQANCGGGKP